MKKYIIMFIMLLLPLNIYAATGSIKASSSSSNVTINNTFTVTVKVSSSGKLGSWQFGVSYDKSKFFRAKIKYASANGNYWSCKCHEQR